MLTYQKSFTLLETLLAILLLGIFGVFSTQLLFSIYQNYNHNNQVRQGQLEAQNALLQIKRLLENAYFESLQILPRVEIANTPISLVGKSLIFYEKLEHFALSGDFAIPCLHGIFEPASLQIKDSTLTLDFLKLSTSTQNNIACNFKLPTIALVITENFITPQDFYNPNFQGKILNLNADSITLEIPLALRMQPLTSIKPQLYFFNSPTLLHFSDSIILEQNGSKMLLVEHLSHFSLKSHALGVYMRLCLQKDSYCASSVVVEL